MALTPPPPPMLLPSRASTARIMLFVLAPFGFLLCLDAAGQTSGGAQAGWYVAAPLVAGALIFVAMRVARDFMPAMAAAAGRPVVTHSRWDWTDVLGFLPATLALLWATQLLLLSPTQAADGSLSPDARTAVESFANQTAYYAAALVALVILLYARRGLRPRDLGWRLPGRLGAMPWAGWLVIAVAVTVVLLLVTPQLGAFSQSLLPGQSDTQCTAVRTEYHGYLALAIPVVSLIAPVAEETIFRGFFYGWLRRRVPVAPAAVVSGVVFALFHAVPVLALPLFVVGVALALMYEYSGSLLPGAVVHGLFNLYGIIQLLGPTTVCQ